MKKESEIHLGLHIGVGLWGDVPGIETYYFRLENEPPCMWTDYSLGQFHRK